MVDLTPVVLAPMADASESEIPATARRLRGLVDERGWRVWCTSARASLPRRVGEAREVVSVAVRLASPSGDRAWGVWVDGRFSAAQVWPAPRDDWPMNVSYAGLVSWVREVAA